MTSALSGIGVLVTRPTGREQGLCEAIRNAGGYAVHLPAMEIEAITGVDARAALDGLKAGDWMIFVSLAAVQQAASVLAAIPAGVRLAAVGESTADALVEAGCRGVLTPAASGGSEALLAVLPRAAVQDQRVLIVRGEGGREQLARELRESGAEVAYLELYRRRCPARAPEQALAALDAGKVHVLTANSGEILDNLLVLLGEARRKRSLGMPLVVPSPRVMDRARALGFSGPIVAAGASDAQVLHTLCELRDRISP